MARVRDDGYTLAERLDLFIEKTEQLLSSEAVRSGAFNLQFSIHAAQGQPVTTMSREPPEEVLYAYLLTFRRFISNKSPVFANRVANMCFQELTSDVLRGRITEAQNRWRGACRQGPLRVVIDDEHLTPCDALDLWINGKYFHDDKRKAQRLDNLDPLGQLFVRHVFLNHIISGTGFVLDLGNTIVLARRQGLLA